MTIPRFFRDSLCFILFTATLLLSNSAFVVSVTHAQQPAFDQPLIAMSPGASIIGDGETEHTLFVVGFHPSGEPIEGMSGRVSPTAGDAARLSEVEPGVYSFKWTAPVVTTPATVTFNVRGRAGSSGSFERQWEVKVHPPMAQQITVSATPSQVVLGQDASANLSFTLSGGPNQALAGSNLKIRTSSGNITNLTHLGGGTFSALFTPPNRPYPHIAVITVADKRNPSTIYGTFSLPLVGKASFPVSSTPNSRVMIQVAGRDFGPVQTDETGRASIPIVVPPGHNSGTLTTVQGTNKVEETLDLQLPTTDRIQIIPMHDTIPADPTLSVPIRAFVTNQDGSPNHGAQVTFTAAAGEVSDTEYDGDGIYTAWFNPPYGNANSQVTIQLEVSNRGTSQTDSITLNLTPARPNMLTSITEPDSLATDTRSFDLYNKVVGPQGVGVSGRDLTFGVSGARVSGRSSDLGNGDYQTRFSTTGNTAVYLVAVVNTPPSTNPLQQIVVLPSSTDVLNTPSSTTAINVLTLDSFGYPVPNVTVALKQDGDGAIPSTVTTDPNGFGQVHFTAGQTRGIVNIEASANGHTGNCSVIQSSKDIALTLPLSGDAASRAVSDGWRQVVSTVHIDREGAQPPEIIAATTQNTRAGSLEHITITSDPANVVAGGSLILRIRATDGNGVGKSRQRFDHIVDGGTIGEITDLGNGNYRASLNAHDDASGEIRVSIASASGDVVAFKKIGVSQTPATTSWTPPSEVSGPPNVTTVTPQSPGERTRSAVSSELLDSLSGVVSRVEFGFRGGFYSYNQKPLLTDGPLYDKSITFGGSTTDPAGSVGVHLGSRLKYPDIDFIGGEVSYNLSNYSIVIPEFTDPVSDWLHELLVAGIAKYTFNFGTISMTPGARVGLQVDDFIVWRQTIEGADRFLEYEPLLLPGLLFGGEVEGLIGDDIFVLLRADIGLAYGTVYYRRDLNAGVGYKVQDGIFAHVNLGSVSRGASVYNEQEIQVGQLMDGLTTFTLGVSYEL